MEEVTLVGPNPAGLPGTISEDPMSVESLDVYHALALELLVVAVAQRGCTL